MKKYFVPFFVLAFSVIASLFVVYSISPDDSSIYDISPDTMPLAIPSTDNQYRFNQSTGKWQVKYGNLAGWGDVPNYFNLNDVMNQWGVALLSDLSTSSDFLDALQNYFSGGNSFEFGTNSDVTFSNIMHSFWPSSSWPSSRYYPGSAGSRPIVYSNLMSFLDDSLNLISYQLMLEDGGVYLTSRGQSVNNVGNLTISQVMSDGILGLGYLLGGGSNSNGHSYFVDLIDGIDQFDNDVVNKNINSNIYLSGQSGPTSTSPTHGLSNFLGLYLGYMTRYMLYDGDYLGSDGTVVSNDVYVSFSDILGQGLVGLGDALDGNSSSPYLWTWVDYKDPSRTIVYEETNILETLVGFVGSIQPMFADYLYSHGTDLDIKERENMNPQAEQFVDDFTGADGHGTPTTGQISDTAGVSGGIKDAFSSSATPADAFGQISDEQNYSFFSSEVQNSLNPFYSSRQYLRGVDDVVDNVSPKLQEILGGLGSSW